MIFRVRRLVVVVLMAGLPLDGATPANAQVEGACVASFNGISADRIDSLDSPLELETTDTLIFEGSTDTGSFGARVELIIGPVTVESGSTAYATPAEEFTATISLDDVTPYGIGLMRAVGTADGCVAKVWIRVSGRLPLTTLTGLTALGLALGGITGQLGAIVSRRRWARSAAALGGIATGCGVAVLIQQFGRLQISYPSLAAASLVAAILGFGAAWFLNPSLREARIADRRVPTPAPRPTRRREATPVQPDQSPEPPTETTVSKSSDEEPEPAGDPTPAAVDARSPDPHTAPYWCYVMAPTDVFGLTDHTTTVAALVPGTWYLAKRTVGGWVQVVAGDGDEGWVAEGSIYRHG